MTRSAAVIRRAARERIVKIAMVNPASVVFALFLSAAISLAARTSVAAETRADDRQLAAASPLAAARVAAKGDALIEALLAEL
jgi:hypothetical protein